MSEAPQAQEVDLMVFQVGSRRYAVDATQVLRVEPCRDAVGAQISSLGPLAQGGRALVFRSEGGEGRLAVDVVNGVPFSRHICPNSATC